MVSFFSHYFHHLLSAINWISWIVYFIALFGVSFTQAPEYIEWIDKYVKLYISLFLMYHFNPWHKTKFQSVDREIVFEAGLFLFGTTTISTALQTILKNPQYFKDLMKSMYSTIFGDTNET